MKVLIIAPSVLNPYLGPSVVANNTLRGFLRIRDELEKNDVEIIFLSLNDDKNRDFGDIKVIASKRYRLDILTGEFQALFKRPAESFDLLHTHVIYEAFPWLFNKVPKLFTLHGILWKERKYKDTSGKLWSLLYEMRLRLYYPKFDKFIAISQYVIDELKAKGFDTSKWVIIENPISDEFFGVKKKEENLILYPARITPLKNQFGLLRALSLIKSEIKDFKVIFAGNGPARYIQLLRNFARKEGLNVAFTGKVPYKKMLELYSRASIVALTSFQETLPMSVIEALATGTPVVASRVGGIPYMVTESKTGFLVDSHNPEEIAKKLLVLVGDEKLRKKLGKNARVEAERRWKAEVIARELLDLYLKLGT